MSLNPGHKNLFLHSSGVLFFDRGLPFHVSNEIFTNGLFFDQMTADHTFNLNSRLLLLNVFHGSGLVVISTVLEAAIIAQ